MHLDLGRRSTQAIQREDVVDDVVVETDIVEEDVVVLRHMSARLS